MSIDRRVVEMQFDNKQFEKGVKESKRSLNEFKSSLELNDSRKELADIAKGVESLTERFSTFGIVSMTALQNLTNKVVDLGLAMVKSLTIDQLTAGFGKYEQQVGSVQTLINSTGKGIDEVEASLEKLIWYADETSYDITEMMTTLGKFTSQGIELEGAITAIQGISNWAALSGQNAQTANRAFYNLAQSIGMGKVISRDWMSIEQANMATKEFKDTAIETAIAMGTLSQAAAANNPFGNLSDGWFTADVLLATLEKYGSYTDEIFRIATEKGLTASEAMKLVGDGFAEVGIKGFKAAQEAKTFTDALNATKDAVSSKWAETFKIVIGNYEEAKELWTNVAQSLWEIFAAPLDAQNEMLREWKELGGRDNILEGLGIALEKLGTLLAPIGEAWREVFPPKTGEMLAQWSERFRDWFASIEIGEETLNNLKDTFKGFFSILSIGWEVVKFLANGLKELIKFLLPVGNGALGATAGIGRFFTKLNETIRSSGLLTGALEGLKFVLEGIGTAFKNVAKFIGDFFDKFKGFDFSFWTVLGKVFLWVGDALRRLGGFIKEVFSQFGSGDAAAFLNMGMLAGAIIMLKKFWDKLKDFGGKLESMKQGILDVLDGVKGALEAWQQSLKASTLLKIASAIAILAGALWVLSAIDKDKLVTSLIAITALFVELFGSMAIFSKIMAGDGFRSMSKITKAMISLSIAILILSFAMRNLATLSWDGIIKGLTAIGVLMLELVLVAGFLEGAGTKLGKGGFGLILFATGLVILSQALKTMGSMQWDEVLRGLTVLTVVLAELVVVAMLLEGADTKIAKGGLGLILFATGLVILSQALKTMGSMKWDEVGRGLTVLTVVLVELVLVAGFLEGAGTKIAKGGLGLILFATGLVILAQALKTMGSMQWDEILRGLTVLTVILAELVAVAIVLEKSGTKLAKGGMNLILLSTGIAILAKAVKTMGSMKWDEIGKGLTVLTVVLAELVLAAGFLEGAGTKFAKGGLSLVLMATGLAILAQVMKVLAGMSWGGIAKGLVALAGIFAIFGVAALLLTPVVPIMFALAGAIALLGVGVLAAGAGLMALGLGLTAISVALAASGGAIYSFIESIIGLIPMILTKIGEGIIAFATVIAGSASAIIGAVTTILVAVFESIIAAAPKAVEALFVLLDAILASLVTYIPKFVDYLFQMLIAVIEVLAQRMPELIAAGAKLLMAFVTGVLDVLGELSGEDLQGLIIAITALIAVFSLIAVLGTVMAIAGVAILAMAGVLAILGGLAQIPGLMWLINEGAKFMGAIGTAIGAFVGGLVGGFAGVASDALPRIGANLAEFMSAAKPFFDGVKGVDESASRGVAALAGAILALTASNMIDGLTAWLTGGASLVEFGKELAEFAPYFKQYAASVAGIDGSVIQASANAALTLAEFASKLPDSGGAIGWITGENSLSAFAQELLEFGPILKKYADSVAGLDADVVTNSANAALALAEFASKIPNSGGMGGWFTGENGLAAFAEELLEFGPKLKEYADSVAGLDSDVVTNSANAALALAEFASKVPNSGGMGGWFTGENNLSDFADELLKFGPKLKEYAESVKGLDSNVVTNSANAAKALSELADNLPDQGGVASWFTGDNNIGTFGANIAKFGRYFKAYYDTVSGVNVDTLNGVISGVWNLVAIAKGVKDIDVSSLGNFGIAMTLLGDTGIDGFMSAFDNAIDRVNAQGETLASTLESGVRSKIALFLQVGKDAAQGFIDGVNSKMAKAAEAGRKLGEATLIAAQVALDSHSPSREFIYLGQAIGDGLAIGINNSIGNPIFATSNMIDQIIAMSQKSVKEFEDWLGERKYYNEISLVEELIAWEKVQARYLEGSEDRKKADREVFRLQNELVKATYQYSLDWIEEEKFYNRLSREEELAAYERMQSRYREGSEERKKIDREIYTLRNELVKDSYEHSMDWIDEEKYYSRLSLEEELAAYERVRARYEQGTEEHKQMAREIYRVQNDLGKAAFQNAMSWIDERKYYNDLTLADELAAYRRLQAQYEAGTDEHKQMAREIYRVENELNRLRENNERDRTRIQEEATEKRKSLEDDYYAKVKDVNEKLRQDIKKLDDDYQNSLDSRTKSLYNAYGLFDKVDQKDAVDGFVLMQNLQDQVDEFANWQSAVDSLSAKGVNKALIEELEQMGPSSIAQVQALNNMTSGELAKYVTLWSDKHKLAKQQATKELENMRIETQSQIMQLQQDAAIELDNLNATWKSQLAELNRQTAKQLSDLQAEFERNFETIHANALAQTEAMTKDVVETVKKEDWEEVGGEMIKGMADGAEKEQPAMIVKMVEIAAKALEAVKNVLGIASPSKAFMEVGKYINEGLAVGLNKYGNFSTDAAKDVGYGTIDTLSKAMSRIGDIVDADVNPAIRPVLDLTNVTRGLNQIDGALSNNRSLTLGATINQNGGNSKLDDFANSLTLANNASNNKMISAIESMEAKIAGLVDKFGQLQVVMDTGTVVGVLAGPMDDALGGLANMTRRGVR